MITKAERIIVQVWRYEVNDNTLADAGWLVARRTFKSVNGAERYARQATGTARERFPNDYVEATIAGLVYHDWEWHEVWCGYLRYDAEVEYVDTESNLLIGRPA